MIEPDDNTLEEFVRRLAKATEFRSWDTGQVLSAYWREEAQAWVEKLDAEKV